MIFNAAELFRIGVGLPWTKMAEQSLFDESAYPMSRTNINDTATSGERVGDAKRDRSKVK